MEKHHGSAQQLRVAMQQRSCSANSAHASTSSHSSYCNRRQQVTERIDKAQEPRIQQLSALCNGPISFSGFFRGVLTLVEQGRFL